MTYYQQTSNEQIQYIYNQANKPYHVLYVPVPKVDDNANHSEADIQHTRSTLAPQTEPAFFGQPRVIQLQANQLMSLPATLPFAYPPPSLAFDQFHQLASMSNPDISIANNTNVDSTPRYNDKALKQMHQNPGFHSPSDLKFQEINHEFSDTFTNTAPSSIMGRNSHYPNHQAIHTNASRNSNNSMSTKTTLNASATDFIPAGYSNKASSKCKVMETITEEKQTASRDEKPDVACPNDDKDAINRFDCKDYKQAHDVDVPSKLKGIVNVPFEFTSKYIPDQIDETLHDVYRYMDKAMAFKNNKKVFENMAGNIIVIINFGFHEYGCPLFCVMEQNNSGKRKWRMKKKLFNKWEIRRVYGIIKDQLPSYHTPNPDTYQIDQNVTQNTFATTKWSRIPIYAKRRTKVKQRRVLHITNQEFMKILKQQSINHNNIIPIISFNGSTISAENVMIVRLTEDTSIGISYKLESSTNILQITGIYLDKNELLTYHQLASPVHKCNCLDDFVSNIDELKIGNVYDEENKIKALQKENKTPIMKYIKKVLKQADTLIANHKKTALLSIKKIFNFDTITQAIENCLKSKQNHSNQQQLQIISSNIPKCNVTDQPMQYLTTMPLPQQSAIT